MIPCAKKERGYSLVEMLVYVSLLSLFSLTIIHTILSFTQSYRTVLALRLVDNTGIDAMERITRDIRAASVIDTSNSTFGSSPGVLALVATANAVSTTTKFYIQGGVLKVEVNGAYSGPLSVAGSAITSLTFTSLSSGASSAVRVDMTVRGTVGPVTQTKTYHDTVILRGS